jgi:hypothetical protein
MMRLIASCAPASSLLGTSDLENALVDGWLSFIWASIDLPLDADLKKDLQQAMAKVEAHLTYNTYLVGHHISVADISLAVSLQCAAETQQPKEDSNLARWYSTIVNAALSKPAAAAPSAAAGIMLNGVPPPVENKFYRRHRIRIKEILAAEALYTGQTVTVAGWARTTRNANKGTLLFVELNDGSTGNGLQCVLDSSSAAGFEECKASGGTGASFQMVGTIVASQGEGQAVELQVTQGKLLGAVYGGNAEGTEIGGALYPIGKKAHKLETMREIAHLRPRTRVHAAAMRIRHSMAYATHTFFHNNGFLYIHTPIVTGADCEGAGEQFAVTTMLGSDHLKPGVKLPIHEPPAVRVTRLHCCRIPIYLCVHISLFVF